MAAGTKPKIGFIGLGLMGSAMVQRLQSLDYVVTVVAHRNRKHIEEAVARGAIEVATAAEVAKNSEIIMLCVDTSAAVEMVMRGEGGVLEQLQKGSMVIDFGTSIPGITRQLAEECKKKGAAMMDAPLGRTPPQAVEGLLNIMAAGEITDFERVKPVLDDLGENVFHVGPIGAGHTLKLINNFFGMTMACAMSEAFSIANACKDVGYYSKMADDFAVPSLMSPAVKSTLGLANASGYGEKMVPEMVDFIAGIFKKD